MRYYTIPLTPEPQSYAIVLAGKEYRLTVRWMEADEGGWLLDIEEPEQAAPILMGLPLITGCDLLGQFTYLGLGGQIWVDSELPARLDNLGTEVDLVFAVEDDVEDGNG
jgi:hypothetical protein